MPILDWLNKNEAVRTVAKVPYRLLEPVADLSYGDPASENMLIQGDNLEALKSLIPLYAGRVKCIYIDPPYNTKSAFEHYDDNLEHSKWLSLMYPRLELLRELLSEDGVIFVNLDENEHSYQKVMMDEIFGRKNYLGDLIWKKRKGGGNDSRFFALDHDYIIVFTKNANKEIHPAKWRVSQTEEYLKRYKEKDEDGRRYYWDTLARDGLQNPILIELDCPDGDKITINSQKSLSTVLDGSKNGEVRFKKIKGKWAVHHKVYMPAGQVLRSVLDGVGTNKTANDEQELLFGDNPFDYPKPENLLQTIIELVTKPGDLVLDSFLGSGTTCAVAHKMGRRYIGIEMGEHAVTHCAPRLKKVVDGEQGGISEAVNWQGGGGFRFYRLGETVFDENGNINPSIGFGALAAHIWFMETRTPLEKKPDSPLLGVLRGTAYYLLYNGILGDRRPKGGNVLTGAVLESLPPHNGPKIIYGEATRFGQARLEAEGITFKQTPYDVRAL
ncbi:MAG: site-specific DNA-methyltransferase [Deltaproteobacteria bacterium]|nr:site-specific DNA-methyltransferase [Deltaproteobacteria bacterium]